MHRPDTMIEIHRERVQDQTVDIFSGDKYTESVDGTGYSATATLDLTLDRVWFILDSHQRLWQEQSDGESHDPLRHFAIDLAIFDSKIVIDSVTCIPLVTLPPTTVTIPDGPRAGESRKLPYNEIPLFGRLTIHDQLERHDLASGKQTIALNFAAQDAPVLIATPLRDRHAAKLFGSDIERGAGGECIFTGQDPRISWELDYAEAYWITHSIAGELMVNLEKLQHPTISDGEARIRVLDSLAAQIGDAVRPKLAEMGENGIVGLLAVYFRSLPAKLWVSCVAAEGAEDEEDERNGVRLVGGRWPTDGHPWKLSNDDAMLFVDSGELQLLVEPDDDGKELTIGVAATADGRRHLRVDGKETEALHELPQCSCTGDRSGE